MKSSRLTFLFQADVCVFLLTLHLLKFTAVLSTILYYEWQVILLLEQNAHTKIQRLPNKPTNDLN